MADEPCLPALARIRSSQSITGKRVRSCARRESFQSVNSSDPAIFSSDDDPSIDNYVQGRRKRRYIGSWFHQQPTSSDSTFGEPESLPLPERKPRTLKRQLDSGVWMGSDETDADADGPELPITMAPRTAKRAAPRQALFPAEQLALNEVMSCVEQGKEDVQLSSLGLYWLSNDIIRPLSGLRRIPDVVHESVPWQDEDPILKLFLSSNFLTRVPGAIFELEHLTVLSLRCNALEELPPSISRLKNLQILNVSQNRLRYLPVELLDLFKPGSALREFLIHPNPLFQTRGLADVPSNSRTGKKVRPTDMLISRSTTGVLRPGPNVCNDFYWSRYVAASPIQYSDTMGNIYSKFKIPEATEEDQTVEVERSKGSEPSSVPYLSKASSHGAIQSTSDKVPSLLELILRSASKSSDLVSVPENLPGEPFRRHRELFLQALEQRDQGGIVCSKCRRTIIEPTARRVEWWEVNLTRVSVDGFWEIDPPLGELNMVPFLSRGCSWSCMTSYKPGKWNVDVDEVEVLGDAGLYITD